MIWNQIKTVILLAGLSSLLIFIGGIIGGPSGIKFALVFSLITNGLAYFFSDKMVLRMYKAKPLDPEKYAWIYSIVNDLAQTMKIPAPKLWMIETPMANAFATGRNPKNASVAVTSGILDILDEHELRGVLAHELSHVKNRDILVATIAATIASSISFLASMARYAAFWGSMGGDRRRNGNPFALLLIAIFMPIAAVIIQLAISRSREYLADETGAHDCQDPMALASALEKLDNSIAKNHMRSDDTLHASTASLFIVYPFKGGGMLSLFSTHPPMSKRIARLRAMYEKMF